jgi:predicted nucleic acid-binding protein
VRKFVLDTNVYINAMRDSEAGSELAAWQRRMAPCIYQHAVVISEILVGAKDEVTLERWRRRWVLPAEQLRRVITPSYGCWLRAARMVTRLIAGKPVQPGHIRPGLFNDCLLAASSHEHGYTIVTHNAHDFALIARVDRGVTFVAPLP